METGLKVTVWFMENNPILLATSTAYILHKNLINVKIVCHHVLIMSCACTDTVSRLQVYGVCKAVTQTANMTQTRLRKEQNRFYWWYIQYSERIALVFLSLWNTCYTSKSLHGSLALWFFFIDDAHFLYQKGKKLIRSFTNTREICNK